MGSFSASIPAGGQAEPQQQMVVFGHQGNTAAAVSTASVPSAERSTSSGQQNRALNSNYDLPAELVQVLVNQQSEQQQNQQQHQPRHQSPQQQSSRGRNHQDQDWINAYRHHRQQ